MAEVAQDPALRGQILFFFFAQFLVYGALGTMAWLLALASRRACITRLPLVWVATAWVATLLTTAYTLNAALYPWSHYSSMHSLANATLISTATVADLVLLTVSALAAMVAVRAAFTFAPVRKHALRIGAYGLVAMLAVAASRAIELGSEGNHTAQARPHVIIIGIDSLRPDVVGGGRAVGVTPNIDAFLSSASSFTDAITPLARTFASWMSVLSGRHPVSSGARDNLMPPELLQKSSTLAHKLRESGYATIYATDEVRFSNIDESYGFDRIIGPKMGTSDFMLASWNDSPLTNLVTNTRLGRWLFPNSFANRAAAKTYRPEVFIDWLDREIDFSNPTFLGVHLTLPHYPYYWAENNDEIFSRVTENPYTYLAAVVAVDRQFGQLMDSLRRHGALENAVVVLISDHGEALGLSSDNLLYDAEAKAAVGKQLISMQGHGSSVLSPYQYRVLLSVRRYDSRTQTDNKGNLRSLAYPVSLEDVAPTVLDQAGVRYESLDFDGHSLAHVLAGEEPGTELLSRMRFTETGLTTTAMRMGNFKEADNLSEGLRFFEVDPKTSRIVFRRDRMAELLAQKERAAMTSDWLLASVPDPDVGKNKYILVKRTGGVPDIVTYDPNEVEQPEFVLLWRAMQARFGPELFGSGE